MMLFLTACVVALAEPECPWEVASAQPYPALTGRLRATEGWTGGDGAQTIPLSPDRTLWLFADTFIGSIRDGRRVGGFRMINNSAAWQNLKDRDAPLRFFWNQSGDRPASLLTPDKPGSWYWPGDGTLVDGRLYLFCKRVRAAPGEPGFGFDWFGNDLLRINNPADEPTAWQVERLSLTGSKDQIQPGVACWLDGDSFYALCSFPPSKRAWLENPVGLARIGRRALATFDGRGWQYWCRGDKWADRPEDLVPLFKDAAPEMTVSKLRGVDGYLATYTAIGIGPEIRIRHAARPEGPWSKPVTVYRCPEAGSKLLLYGGKAHPELAERDGHLVVTYCRNIGDLGEHARRPDVYFPQAVAIQLRRVTPR